MKKEMCQIEFDQNVKKTLCDEKFRKDVYTSLKPTCGEHFKMLLDTNSYIITIILSSGEITAVINNIKPVLLKYIGITYFAVAILPDYACDPMFEIIKPVNVQTNVYLDKFNNNYILEF